MNIMGFFKKFKSSEEKKVGVSEVKVPWQNLISLNQLDVIVAESKNLPIAIFKHSTRCGVSRGVLKAFEKKYSLSEDQFKIYFLDLLANRDISNEIASRFKVHHESPQIIVLKNGEVVYHDSHNAIDASELEKWV